MYKPMTDEQLRNIEYKLNNELLLSAESQCIAHDLLDDVRRLRAEAIVWHPWPGVRPDKYGLHQVTIKDMDTLYRTTGILNWHDEWQVPGTRQRWEERFRHTIIRWTEVSAPYGGE